MADDCYNGASFLGFPLLCSSFRAVGYSTHSALTLCRVISDTFHLWFLRYVLGSDPPFSSFSSPPIVGSYSLPVFGILFM